jgi:hypothetical protein
LNESSKESADSPTKIDITNAKNYNKDRLDTSVLDFNAPLKTDNGLLQN